MLVTAALAVLFAILQIHAVGRRPAPYGTAALLLYVLSAALFWWAVSVTRGKLAACGQGAVSAEVITAGPYRHIRHPFYTSYDLTWVAGFAATGWWPLAVGAVAMAIVYERAAREEERGLLAGRLAPEYGEYKRRAGRYLPYL